MALFVDLDLKSSQIIEWTVLPVTNDESGKLLTTSVRCWKLWETMTDICDLISLIFAKIVL